jgi:hypothetical protein
MSEFNRKHAKTAREEVASGREASVLSGIGLHREVEAIRSSLFPVKERPAGKPGYVSYDRNCFTVLHEVERTRKDMGEYFLSKDGRRGKAIYGNSCLAEFFEAIGYSLLVDGKAFYAIDWDTLEVNGNHYLLPKRFRYLRTSTMRTRKCLGRTKGFKQKYSLIAKRQKKGVGFETCAFNTDEVLFLRYPFGKKSPVQQSLKYVKQERKFWEFNINKSQAAAEPDNLRLPIERARHSTFSSEKRKHDLAS